MAAVDGKGVVVSAAAGGGVSVLGPGVPAAGGVSERGGGVFEAVVAAAAEARDFLASGFHGDGGHAGVGGEMLAGGVAGAVISLSRARHGTGVRPAGRP